MQGSVTTELQPQPVSSSFHSEIESCQVTQDGFEVRLLPSQPSW